MKTVVDVLAPSREFHNKDGRQGYVADCTFNDEGARFVVGRGRVYSDSPLAKGAKVTAVLGSYDREGSRWWVR